MQVAALDEDFGDLLDHLHGGLPARVLATGKRTLANVLATAVGAGRHESVEILLDYAREHGGPPRIRVPGRSERTDPYHAALVIGHAAHVQDFDDTHLETVIHCGAANLGAMLVASQVHRVTGLQALTAFIMGCETQLRVGMAMSPEHYDRGWHITGTTGVIGATVTAGLIAGLSRRHLMHALGLAGTQSLGARAALGTMTKAYHPGKAAANGLLATMLAASGFPPGPSLHQADGYFATLADNPDSVKPQHRDGDWEILRNTYKPYPCGIVIHPIIDGALSLRAEVDRDRIDAAEVRVYCHPLVVELTGLRDPATELEARFSTVHCTAVALLDGTLGPTQFSKQRVNASDVLELRDRVRLIPTAGVARDAASIEYQRRDGTVLRVRVDHARGSLERPLTDQEFRSKIEVLVDPVLPGKTEELLAAVHALDGLPSIDLLLDVLGPVAASQPDVRR